MALAAIAHPVLVRAAPDNRTIVTVITSPCNSMDQGGNINLQIDVSGGAVGNENPDNQGGYRYEVYDASGKLVRRIVSAEINTDPTAVVSFDGTGDDGANLPYGSYTLRSYVSMRDPEFKVKVQGNGITIDRSGDLFVTPGGVLSWVNTGNRLSFCQVSLGDPNTEDPTFLRLVDYPSGMGQQNTDMAYGIAMNSKGEVFVTDSYYDGLNDVRIAKYSTATETWINLTWATEATTSNDDDEWVGLFVDGNDSVYLAMCEECIGGNNGTRDGAVRFRDNGTTGAQHEIFNSNNLDIIDIAALTDSWVYLYRANNGNVRRHFYSPLSTCDRCPYINNATVPRGSIWAVDPPDPSVYITESVNDRFLKYPASLNAGSIPPTYSVTDPVNLDEANGIAVWRKSSTNETFIIVASGLRNQIAIYKENAAGDSASFVRLVKDDPANLKTPSGIGVNSESGVLVLSRGQRSVKLFDKFGVFQNLPNAPNGEYIQGSDATSDLSDSSGFNQPIGIAVDDATGEIYVFDHDDPTIPTQVALKKFSATGKPLGVIRDIDASWAPGVFNQPVMMAIWANNSIYAVTTEDAGRLIRFDSNGNILAHAARNLPGSQENAGPPGGPYNDPPEYIIPGGGGRDYLGVAVGPYYDRANGIFYETAVYALKQNERIDIFHENLTFIEEVIPSNPVLDDLSAANYANPILVDQFGEIYILEGNAADPDFFKYTAGNRTTAPAANGLLTYQFTVGTGNGQVKSPRQMLFADNKGVYKKNPVTGRYEVDIWFIDEGNDRLQKWTLAWNDVKDTPISIVQSQDTPVIVSASITGETVTTIGGIYYVGEQDSITIQINIGLAGCGTSVDPNTQPIVQIKPNGQSFVNVDSIAYGGNAWSGTVAITASMNDGQAEIRVQDVYDNAGSVRVQDPNPDQTDFDPADGFQHFIIDKTAPVFSVTNPPATGDQTSAAQYSVSGQVTSEATGLDATILIEVWTDSTGGSVFDSLTVTASATDGTFSGLVDLRGPAPTDNWIQVTAIDKLGNRSQLSSRRLVKRVKNVGNAFITPSDEIQVGTLRRYEIRYTAAQALSGDTLSFVIPDSWSDPQKTSPTTNGYFTVSTGGSYSDSIVSGDTITIRGVTLSIGQTLSIFYGDTVGSTNGAAGPDVNASLADADNTFKVYFQQSGSDTLDPVPAATGKTLTVPVRDSFAGFAVIETGPLNAASVEFPLGTETKVLVVRSYNTNVGNHANRVTQVVLSVESNTGGVVAWRDVASKVVVKNPSKTFATVTSFPTSNQLTITLTDFTVGKGATRDMEFWVTAGPTATADTVRFFFSGITAFTAVDSASGKALEEVEQETGVSPKTGLYDLVGRAPADTLSLGADTSFAPPDVAVGQVDVAVMDILFANDPPGAETPVNDIRVDQIQLVALDTNGNPVNASHVFKGVHLRDKTTFVNYGGLDTPAVPNSETMTFALSGLKVPSGNTVTVRVWVDIVGNTVSVSTFRLRMPDTRGVDAKDAVRQVSPQTIRDAPGRPEVFPYVSPGVKIFPLAEGTLEAVTLLRADSSVICGECGDQILTGEQIYVALRYKATAGRSNLRVIPSDTDLKLFIGGVDKTSEFTISAITAAKTVTAGQADTFIYSVIQNLGSTTGELRVEAADTAGPDTRPRLYDAHDYFDPDRLRARLVLPTANDTALVTSAPLEVFEVTLSSQIANPGETAVPALAFRVKNNKASSVQVDSVSVEGISSVSTAADTVRLYHDNGNGVFSPSQDTLVATAAWSASDTARLALSPKVSIGASGKSETFFVVLDFKTIQTDGDTVDVRLSARGVVTATGESAPSGALDGAGFATVEVVASRVTVAPESQIVAVSSKPTVTLKAVDRYGNLDAVANVETTVQGHNVQVQVTLADSTPGSGETKYHITATVGMTSVTPAPGLGVQAINGKLSGGQGTIEVFDTGAETVSVTVASVLEDSVAQIQFAKLTSVSVLTLTADSAAPDSKGFLVLAFRVTNQSGATDTMTRVGLRSLSANDAEVVAVVLFRDLNGNNKIDSGTDKTVATGNFTNGFVTFSSLSETIADGDSAVFLVGFDIATSVVDRNLVDAQADTVTMANAGEIVSTPLNSTVDRRIDVRATRITITPRTGSFATGDNFTVTATAADNFGNTDKDYTGNQGSGEKVEFTLSGSAQWVSTTLANEDIDPPPDPPTEPNKVQGNFTNGTADLTFTDANPETVTLTVTLSPGLPVGSALNDTGEYTIKRGFVVTALPLGFGTALPGDTNRVILRFKISATGTSDSVTKIVVTWVGTATADVTNARLYKDMNGNEVFDAGTDTFYGTNPVSFSGATATFTGETLPITDGTSKAFFFVVDVDGGASPGDTMDAEIRPDSITTEKAQPGVPDAVVNSTGHETIVSGAALTVSAVALPGGTVPPGAKDVEIGRFSVTVPTATGQRVLDTVVVTNAGTHPDTGLLNLRLYVDANGNGTLEIGTDTLYGTVTGWPTAFTNGRAVFDGSETFPDDGSARRFFVVADLSETLAVDGRTLLVRLDAGSCTFTSGETRPTADRTPASPTSVGVVLSSSADSVVVVGGEGIADGVDTVLVSVSVVDSAGNPATGRSVTLTLLDAGPTIVSANPVTTGDSGVALFYLTHTVAGAYRCTAAVDGVGKASVGVVSFVDSFGAVLVAYGNDTRAEVGAGKWVGNPAFGRVTRDNYYYMAGSNAPNNPFTIEYVSLTGGGKNVLYTGDFAGGPAPDFLGSVRVDDIDGDGTQEVVFTAYDDVTGFMSEIYYVELGGGAPTKISPDDPRDTDGLDADFSDRSWRTFDVDTTSGGDTIWAEFDGGLATFTKSSGLTFNPSNDSPTIRFWTTIETPPTFAAGANGGIWIRDPEVSPDGKRVAFTVLYLHSSFGTCDGSGGDSAEIWVLKDLSSITPGTFPDSDEAGTNSNVDELTDPQLVQITRKEDLRFAWRPHWSKDGSVLVFSADTTGNFNYHEWVCNFPWDLDVFGASDFDIYMTWYDVVNETAPYRPAKFAYEKNWNELAGEFDWLGDSYAYQRLFSNTLWQNRVTNLSNEGFVTTNGGVLFDSGRVVAFIPAGENLAAGARIASRTPPTTPPAGTDSRLVITGAAKEFFAPDNPDTHVFFSETVTLVIYYDAGDFAADELVGFDSDGDGIPDRTEANLNVYYWDDAASKWVAYATTRDPDNNRLVIQTNHFSHFAAGYEAQQAGTSVHEVIAWPNPWRSDVGSAGGTMKFGHLPAGDVTVRIYTIAGQKVLEGTVHTVTNAGDRANGHLVGVGEKFTPANVVEWDLRNQHGRPVASGVYIVTFTGPGGTAVRKVAVIR